MSSTCGERDRQANCQVVVWLPHIRSLLIRVLAPVQSNTAEQRNLQCEPSLPGKYAPGAQLL